MKHIGKRWLAGLMAATVAFAVAFGAAASLGLTVDTLSADQAAIGACDSAVAASYTTEYDVSSGAYTVDVVTLSGVDQACDATTFKVTLADSGNVSLGFVNYTDVAGNSDQVDPAGGANQSVTFDFTGQDVLAEDVVLIAVSITE